jgi:ABC-type transport system involved in multi-copper enzyme maturation permease subunit
MLKHLIIKEMRDIITNSRSLFVLLICVILIPLALYLSTREFELKRESFRDANLLYLEQSKDQIYHDFVGQGYIPPSPLSIFSKGLDDYLPEKILTNADNHWELQKNYELSNPIGLIFGKIDLQYIITVILSLLALMFTYNSIVGEKQSGTLKLIAANSVPRWKIIIAKIAGSYLAYIVSFIVGIILGLILITLTTEVPVLSGNYLVPFINVLLISLLFIFIMFNIGIFMSILSQTNGSAITSCLLIWIFLAVIIPKVSPMVSQMIYPIKTQAEYKKQIDSKQKEINDEFNQTCKDLLSTLMKNHNFEIDRFGGDMWGDPGFVAATKDYDEKLPEIKKIQSERMTNEIGKIKRDFRNEQLIQQSICKNISRISPVSSFTYLVSDICNTGLSEILNVESNATQFSLEAGSRYYSIIDKNYKKYLFYNGTYSGFFGASLTANDVKIPSMDNYHYPSVQSALFANWPDLLLICFYALLFFALSVFTFIRYDVR